MLKYPTGDLRPRSTKKNKERDIYKMRKRETNDYLKKLYCLGPVTRGTEKRTDREQVERKTDHKREIKTNRKMNDYLKNSSSSAGAPLPWTRRDRQTHRDRQRVVKAER